MHACIVCAQESRARWNSVESIMQFGWSGSAVVGGFLIDHYSFKAAFLGTAAVQLISVVVCLAVRQ